MFPFPLMLAILLIGCQGDRQAPADGRAAAADAQVRARWGKGTSDLPAVRLVAISPHNENIQKEFEWAFALHHAVEHGERVDIEWRTVGGGGTSIETFLLNQYARSETADIDVIWGGGEFTIRQLASSGVLEPMRLSDDVLRNIPRTFSGQQMYDPGRLWCGSAVSGFGFIYNAGMLERCRLAPPRTWDDLGDERFADLVSLADPTQSSSAAAAYKVVVQSGSTWPEGWGRLLRILANANRFTDSAGSAANAPALGEALVATCIDFYGTTRVKEAPDELAYVSPRGETAFSPDPIAILKNPPNRPLAQRFVDFVLSRRGQALWALRVGEPDGPVRSPLARQPIRRDVYETYAGKMSAWIVNPYQAGQALVVQGPMTQVDMGVLRQLVRAAAIDNREGLRLARGKLIALRGDPARRQHCKRLLAEFNALPDDIAALEMMPALARKLEDPTQQELIVTGWGRFFRDKYARIVEN